MLTDVDYAPAERHCPRFVNKTTTAQGARGMLGRAGGIPTPASRRKSLAPNFQDDAEEDAMASPDFKVPTLSASRKSSSTSLRPISRPKTPTALSSSSRRPPVSTVNANQGAGASQELAEGDKVEALGFEGILRYLGAIGNKEGIFGGIELTGSSRGRGKNNGSVGECVRFSKGLRRPLMIFCSTKYFECDPLCGIFVPAAKIAPAFAAPELPLSFGLGRSTNTTPNTRQSKSSAEASRAAEARINPGSRAARYLNMTASQLSNRSQTVPAQGPSTPTRSATLAARGSPEKTTPRATKPRASLGATPTPRKSLGGSTSMPVPKSTLRRPSSRASNIPDVPQIPSTYSQGTPSHGRRTPSISSLSGRATPSREPSEKRYSGLESFGSPTSRPTTPSRSVSRQSTTSDRRRSGIGSYSARPASRVSTYDRPASRTGLFDRPASRTGTDQHEEVERLQAELAAALRSVEESRVAQSENEKALKAGQARFDEVSRRLEHSESELKAALASAQQRSEAEQKRLAEEVKPDAALQAQLDELKTQLQQMREANEQSQAYFQEQLAARDVAKSKLEQSQEESEKEKAALNAQLEQLREAGQDLCAVYEERLREVEQDKMAIQRALESTETDLAAAREQASAREEVQPPLPPNAAPATSPAAMAIDNENLRADNEHMRDRIHKLEEQLDDLRYTLESETDRAREKRLQGSEVEAALYKEIEDLKSSLKKAQSGEADVGRQLQQVEAALRENRTALENERAELEVLRADSSNSGASEKLSSLQRELAAAHSEKEEARQQVKDLEEEIALLEEIKTDQAAVDGSQDLVRVTEELKRREEEVETLKSQLAQARSGADSDQRGVTSDSHTNLSTRDRGDVPSLKDQIVGLKVIISQLTEENRELGQQNKALLGQADVLREAQSSLEATVETYAIASCITVQHHTNSNDCAGS